MFEHYVCSVKLGGRGEEASCVAFRLPICFRFFRSFLKSNDGRHTHGLYLAITCPTVVNGIQLYYLLPLNLHDGKRELLETLILPRCLGCRFLLCSRGALAGQRFPLLMAQFRKLNPVPPRPSRQALHCWSLPENAGSHEAALHRTGISSFRRGQN